MADDKWRDELRQTFARFDDDASGLIDEAEFNSLLDALGSKLSSDDRKIGFALVDKDSDGSVGYDELAEWWSIIREEATDGQ
jgi:Ca2+-binding EF-hand superfamily protein